MLPLPLALALLACRPLDCHDPVAFDAMEVTDHADVGAVGLDVVHDAVASFATWTGRDGLCVDEIRVVPRDAGWDGMYNGPAFPLRIAKVEQDVVHHELCHVLDHDERLSVGRPDLFPREGGLHHDLTERFAYGCETPGFYGLYHGLDARCGRPMDAATASFLRERVWWDYPGDPLVAAEPVDVRITRYPMDRVGEARPSRWSAGGDALYAIGWATGDPAWPDGALIRVDPFHDAITGAWPLPDGAAERLREVLPSADGPPVIVFPEERGGAWTLVGDAVAPIPFPALATLVVEGAVSGGVARIAGDLADDDVDGDVLVDVDLATGAWTEVDAPGLVGVSGVEVAGDAVLVAGWWGDNGDRAELAVGPPGGGIDVQVPWPTSWGGSMEPVLTSDGRVVVDWELPDGLAGIAVLDPADGTWRLPADPCGLARVDRRAWPFGYLGDAWFDEWVGSDGGKLPEGAWLTRVELLAR